MSDFKRFTGARLTAWLVGLNVVAMIAVAVWFRCHDLANLPGVNGDEAWYGVQAELVLHGQPITWHTPTGNLLNPLFFGPQLLLHAIFEPSFALLRATAAASGILALVVNSWLCRDLFGKRVALISTAILAVLPINIVYSRLAWDACQSLLVTLPAIYLPLRAIREPVQRLRFCSGGLAALAVSIVVHPTNIFVAPIVATCLVIAWREELRALWRSPFGKGAALVSLVVGGAVLGSVGVSRAPAFLGRVTNPADYTAFGVNVGRLFSGATVFEYVSGAVAPVENEFSWNLAGYDVAAGIAVGLLGWGLYRVWREATGFTGRNADPLARVPRAEDAESCCGSFRLALAALAIGWGLCLTAFFIMAGPAAIAPHFERYGICLIGPGAILAAIALGWWLDRPGAAGRIAAITAVAAGWLLLWSFQANFFDYLQETGGQSHLTFRTAAIEPKQAALDYIVAHSDPTRDVLILTSEWWSYWPLRYLGQDGLLPDDRRPDGRLIANGSALSTPSASRRIIVEAFWDKKLEFIPSSSWYDGWIVEFCDSPDCAAVRGFSQREHKPLVETTICDFAGRPVLTLFRCINR